LAKSILLNYYSFDQKIHINSKTVFRTKSAWLVAKFLEWAAGFRYSINSFIFCRTCSSSSCSYHERL